MAAANELGDLERRHGGDEFRRQLCDHHEAVALLKVIGLHRVFAPMRGLSLMFRQWRDISKRHGDPLLPFLT